MRNTLLPLCLSAFFLTFLFTGCAGKGSTTPLPIPAKIPSAGAKNFCIDDPDQVLSHAQTYRLPRLSAETEATLARLHKQAYYDPWNREGEQREPFMMLWPWKSYPAEKGFGMNHRPLTKAWGDALYANADPEGYPSREVQAITASRVDLRNFPTREPYFLDFNEAGEGFPFDYLQNSGVAANKPVAVTHVTKDGGWLFVESSFASGWVPAREIAFMMGSDAKRWREAERQIVVTGDDLPVYDRNGAFLFYANLGTLFPLVREEEERYVVSAAVRNRYGEAVMVQATLPKTDAAPAPLPMTPENIAKILTRLTGQSYGWGGLLGNRDCSATVRDFYAPFGIWLPRNSGAQADAGNFLSFEGMTPEQKEQTLLEKGIPFATLVSFPGHIALYVGESEGNALIFHNMWGIKTEENGKEGRDIVGRAAVTTLWTGMDRAAEGSSLIDRARGMTLLPGLATSMLVDEEEKSSN